MSQNNFENCNINSNGSIHVGDKGDQGSSDFVEPGSGRGRAWTSRLYVLVTVVLIAMSILYMTWPESKTSQPVEQGLRPVIGESSLREIKAAALKMPDRNLIFSRSYSYQAGENDSKNSSRDNAVQEVKRLLLEEMGTYLVSSTQVEEGVLKKDTVSVASTGLVKLSILEEKWDGRTYSLKAEMTANPRSVLLSLHGFLQDNQ